MIPVLELKNVTKVYKNKPVVNKVSFRVNSGEIFGFVGPNGAGKSTTLKMICGLAKPTFGDIFINGKPLSSNFEKSIARVGAFIEIPEMYGYLSGLDNLKIMASFYDKKATKRIDKIVNMVGLSNRIKDRVSTYSLGMKQRLGLAQALLNKPDILILDEPTNGLDPNGIIEVRNIIIDLAKNSKIAIIISSHNLAELQQVCDIIAIIDRGSIVEYKTMQQIKAEAAQAQKISIKVDYPHYCGKIIEESYKLKAEIIGSCVIFVLPESRIAEVLSFLINKKLTVFGLEKINKTLEEMFLDIINRNGKNTSIF